MRRHGAENSASITTRAALPANRTLFRYRPFTTSIVRAGDETSDAELARILLAGAMAGVKLEISSANERPFLTKTGIPFEIETEAAFIARLVGTRHPWQALRAPHAGSALKAAATEASLRLSDHPVLLNGRLELLWLLREQSISTTLHRYGNIVAGPEKSRQFS
jgi:RHH-type transcriptional regulator, proline utilization regulon repressor / proline dehydrogenase / delta 1-pyrroline-5-carboxylate dehydrogenase